MTFTLGLQPFLVVSAILFSLGIVCVLSRRNAIGLLMGIELMLNSANLNLVAFSRFVTQSETGQLFSLFVIALAAAEAAIAMAIVLSLHRTFRNINVNVATRLKG